MTNTRTGRRVGYAAVAALVTVTGLALANARRTPSRPAAATPAPTTPAPTTAVPTTPPATPDAVETTPPPAGPFRLDAAYWNGAHDPLLLSGPAGVTSWGSGDPRAVTGLGKDADDTTRILLRVTGGTVVLDREPSGDFPAPVSEVLFVADGTTTATRAGRAQDAVPGARANTAWLVDYVEDDGHAGWTPTARRVDLRSGQVRATVTLPYQTRPFQEVSGGRLLLTPTEGYAETLLWDPATRKVVRTIKGRALDATANHLLWTPDQCAKDCLRLTDLATGRTRSAGGPLVVRAGAALSPDARRAALFAGPVDGNVVDLAVVDLRTGEWRVVGRSRLDATAAGAVTWSRDARSVYALVSPHEADESQLAVWRDGWSTPRLLRASGFFTDLVTR